MKMRGGMAAAVIAACSIGFAAPVFAEAPSKTCQNYGEAAFAAWTQGLYSQMGQHFAPEVAEHLPPGVLHRMWEQMEAAEGKFVSLGQFKPGVLDHHELMVAPIVFSSKRLAALFSCDAQNRITGIQILDPAAVPGLKALLPPAH